MSSLSDAARWLKEAVGLGGIFTKEQLREAFPGVTQIDRRVRDLRAAGWVIHTRVEDPMLGMNQMRLVTIGDSDRANGRLSSKARREVLLEWAYTCALCGAPGSSTYPDAQNVRVQLVVIGPGNGLQESIPVCLRCRQTGLQGFAVDEPTSSQVKALADLDADQWRRACLLRLRQRFEMNTH